MILQDSFLKYFDRVLRTVEAAFVLLILFAVASCSGNERSTIGDASVERAVKHFGEESDSLGDDSKVIVNQVDRIVEVDEIDFEALRQFKGSDIIGILPLGMFHGEDIPAGHYLRNWFGLYSDASGSRLRKVDVEFRPAFDPILDEAGEMTAKEVILTGDSSKPIVLISGVEDLPVEGPFIPLSNAEGIVLSLPHILEPGHDLFLTQGLDVKYMIRIYGDEMKHAAALLRKGEVVRREVFAGAEAFDDARMDIRWAGDLNGDSKPDFLLNIAPKYSYSHWALFLSDPGGERLLVPVADLKYTGC